MWAEIQADIWGICLGSAYADDKIFKMSALREKKLLQEKIIGMKRIIIALVWAVTFITGLILILDKIRISRYVSDLNGVFAAGIILSVVSGLGLLLEMYGNQK